MSVVSQFKDLAVRYSQLDAANRHKEQASQLVARAQEVDQAADALCAALSNIQVLSDGGVLQPDEVPGPPPDPFPNMHESVKETVHGDRMFDLSANNQYRPWLVCVNQWARDLRVVAENGWSNHKSSTRESLPGDNFLNLVGSIPDRADSVRQFKEICNRWQEFPLPESAERMEAAHTLSQSLKDHATELNPDDWPQDVLAFLEQAQRGGAELDLFTESVRQFLKDKNLLRNIRVRFS